MRPILSGIETEYGLDVEGRSAGEQIEESQAFVRSYPGECLAVWDYRFESPRSDLRGFQLERLAFDPEDAKFDEGVKHAGDAEVRSDRVLPNGARFYNDHGHPEYATPECWSLHELALHDKVGESIVRETARAVSRATGKRVRVFKNNSDYHGASYGTHESYLVPRAVGFQPLFEGLLPLLVARTFLCGAGKVGSEQGTPADFQASQRADFFVEPVNAETLYRRPIFNTRDEPHADPNQWIRLHVICGDANQMASCTKRKVGLVKLALALVEAGRAPKWELADPVRAIKDLSRDAPLREVRLELKGSSWTTPRALLESYLDEAEALLAEEGFDGPGELEDELVALIAECRGLLEAPLSDHFRRNVEWATKQRLLESFREQEDLRWRDPNMLAVDLAFHDLDPEEGLYQMLAASGEVEPEPAADELELRALGVREGTRARARGWLVANLPRQVRTLSWGVATLGEADELHKVALPPEVAYPEPSGIENAKQFVEWVRSLT